MLNSKWAIHLVGYFLGLFACAAVASAEFSDGWKKIDFVTVGGDEVLIEMQSDSISNIAVTIRGKKIDFPKKYYEDLRAPDLNRAVLVSSSGIIDGKVQTFYAIEFPLTDPSLDFQKFEDMNVVHFVIQDGAVIERDIWENSQRLKLKSRTQYKT